MYRSSEWKITDKIILVLSYIVLIIVTCKCETIYKNESKLKDSSTKNDRHVDNKVDIKYCHTCESSDVNDLQIKNSNSVATSFLESLANFTETSVFVNRTEKYLMDLLEEVLDEAIRKDVVIFDGVELKSVGRINATDKTDDNDIQQSRALFSSYTYEYRLYKKIKEFLNTHKLSINIPKASSLFGFRCKYVFKII